MAPSPFRTTTKRRYPPRHRSITVRLSEYERWVIEDLITISHETRSALLRRLLIWEGQRLGRTRQAYAKVQEQLMR